MPVACEIRTLLLTGDRQTELLLLPESSAMSHLPEYQVEIVDFFSFLSKIFKVISDSFLSRDPEKLLS